MNEAMLTEQQLIAVLAGAGDIHVLQRVRGIFEYAATMRVYEQGPIAKEDVVLTLDFHASYTRQEVLDVLEVIKNRTKLTAAPKPVGGS